MSQRDRGGQGRKALFAVCGPVWRVLRASGRLPLRCCRGPLCPAIRGGVAVSCSVFKVLISTGRRLTPPVPMGRPMSARPGGGGWTCTSGGGMPSALRALVFFLLRWFVSIAASYGNVYGLPAVRAMTVKPELTIGTDAFNLKHHTFSFLPS